MNHYVVRFAYAHESFRKAELEALARQEENAVDVEVVDYRADSPFCVIRIVIDSSASPSSGQSTKTATGIQHNDVSEVARSLISRSILSRSIYELWGQAATYDLLHKDIQARGSTRWEPYRQTPFRFSFDTFCGKRSLVEQRQIINSFRYMNMQGKISMKNPEVEFTIFEDWDDEKQLTRDRARGTAHAEVEDRMETRQPRRLFFGRFVGRSRRHLVDKHDLKKRPYISTTSMDAELALLTASLALAGPGKIFLDPFVGTGGFMVAASELGSLTLGADIDGRSFRGKGPGTSKGVEMNFQKYGLTSLFGNCFISDLTNTPLRLQGPRSVKMTRWLDGIIADPPYGVREGLKVLGTKRGKPVDVVAAGDGEKPPAAIQPHYIGGVLAHTLPDYIAPKIQYSFTRMLDDILDFAARTLVDGGRLAFWMPSANELNQELVLPHHPLLELKHVCVQMFNKWSRRLLVFERLTGDVPGDSDASFNRAGWNMSNPGSNANELNSFRKMYFQGFDMESA